VVDIDSRTMRSRSSNRCAERVNPVTLLTMHFPTRSSVVGMNLRQLYPKPKYRSDARSMPTSYSETKYVSIGRTPHLLGGIIFGLLSLSEEFVPVYSRPQKLTIYPNQNLPSGQSIEEMDYTC